MAALPRLLCAAALALLLWAGFCSSVCVEVPSETEAVQGTDMKLLCISCMKREEVTASTVVEWYYRPNGGKDEPVCVTGVLSLSFLAYPISTPGHSTNSWQEKLQSCPWSCMETIRGYFILFTAGEDFTSVISEIMMYILLVFLTLWLLIEMIYCYRKVSKAEEAAQENATDYLAIPSENKENCAVPVEE
uniref:Sodium voltage-gated channel beta subunit 3 n=1 Tax=Junco hyemalis TaxID=40217 RepID=A0A8C5NQE4_JUNHY